MLSPELRPFLQPEKSIFPEKTCPYSLDCQSSQVATTWVQSAIGWIQAMTVGLEPTLSAYNVVVVVVRYIARLDFHNIIV